MDQPKKTEQELAQEFIKKYQTLCEEYGYQLVITPVWIARDDGTFSMKLNTSVGKMPKEV